MSYPGKHFEIREHDAPTKYVWNGETRVARVTGSLSPAPRVQRLRVWPGWNLCSLAVTTSLSAVAGEGQVDVIRAAFRWSRSTKDWTPVAFSETLPSGTILWIQAAVSVTLRLAGPYADPGSQVVASGGDFVAGAGVELWNLDIRSNSVPLSVWGYDSSIPGWIGSPPTPLALATKVSTILGPGDAAFVGSTAPVPFRGSDTSLRIRYYQQDHLGSSSFVTDDSGDLIAAMTFYPFGSPRAQSNYRGSQEPYEFGQKEQDNESQIDYLGARFYHSILGRFLNTDPLLLHHAFPTKSHDENPREGNCYWFVLANPLRYTDPLGLKEEALCGDPQPAEPSTCEPGRWNPDPHGLLNDTRISPQMREAAKKALASAISAGLRPEIHEGNGGFRDPAESDRLNKRMKNGGPRAAPGGSSAHNYGLAIDIDLYDSRGRKLEGQKGWYKEYARLAKHLEAQGFVWFDRLATKKNDSGHFEYHPNWQQLVTGKFIKPLFNWAQKMPGTALNNQSVPNPLPYLWHAAGAGGSPPESR